MIAIKSDQKDLRMSRKSSEILANLVRLSMREGFGFLWQNFGSSRKVWPVQMKSVSVDTRLTELAIDFDGTSLVPHEVCFSLDDIDISKPLYFKGDEKEILFKTEEGSFFINDGHVYLPVPEIAFFKEMRVNPRFMPKEDLSVSLKKFVRGKGHSELSLRCRNFSKGGIGLTLSYGNAHLFKKAEKVYIERFAGIELPRVLEGSIAYVRKFHEEKENKILMGLSFKDELSDKMYDSLMSYFQ